MLFGPIYLTLIVKIVLTILAVIKHKEKDTAEQNRGVLLAFTAILMLANLSNAQTMADLSSGLIESRSIASYTIDREPLRAAQKVSFALLREAIYSGCRKSGLRHFFEVFIAPLRLRRGQGAMQRNPCYARLFADLPYTPPNPIIASGGCGPRTPKGFSTGWQYIVPTACIHPSGVCPDRNMLYPESNQGSRKPPRQCCR